MAQKTTNGQVKGLAKKSGRKFQSVKILDHHVSEAHLFCQDAWEKDKELAENGIDEADVKKGNMPWLQFLNGNCN